ncbi:MAG: hypothetical protein FJ278_01450, partial [Planctomycetes bacterium]|nr:hypothetical protein [Planctomycetota bacterium]
MSTIVHVTHEAVEKIGGIGAVLQGLLTSRKYDEAVGRSILVGPLFHWTPSSQRLGKGGEILFSSIDGVHRAAESWALREIERRFNVSIVYGRRVFEDKDMGVTARPEVLLIETYQADQQMENAFKFKLWQRFGLASDRYESIGDYEQYLRIAEPAYEALKVLLGQHGPWPCHVISHEYMGMPLVLKALLEGDERFRTIFYAHEVATVRPIVEGHPGHDTMFYNVLDGATREGRCLEDVFGPQDH